MFSDVNKVTEKLPIASDPRAKQTDTREEILRHDPEQERRKGAHKGFANEQGLFGDDQTEVSVESLEAFLPMLLKNFSAKERFSEKSVVTENQEISSPSAQAAGAYARTAQYAPVQNPEIAQDVEGSEDVSFNPEEEHPTLSNAEVQAIHRLQADVKKLRAKGVKAIYINKAGTFLESLQNAVREAL